jgi:Tfp pilus assembly protein PilF
MLNHGKWSDAERRLKAVDGALAADDPQKAYVQAYLAQSQMGQGQTAEAEKKLREALKEAPEGKLRGLIHNLLGDYCLKTGKPKEAFWHYLRVDALYNEDPEEQAKALYNLAKLFASEKRDPVRGNECLTRLKEERFAGTEAQTQALREEKK